VEYLKDAAATGANPVSGKRTVVIGGGNVAMDVARTARRQGASQVTIVCLESREEMPASPWEVEEAELEGIEIVPRWGVKQILAANGRVTGLELKAVERVFDEEGRFAPTYFTNLTASREAEVVIMAIGQKADLRFLTPEDTIELTPRGLIKSDPDTLATSREGVFAGGDAVSGPYIAIAAVAAGREAATSIDRYLNGLDLEAGREKPLRPIPKEEGRWSAIPADAAKRGRARMPHTPVAEWPQSFAEINLGFTEAEAVAEAERCLNCGLCSECLQCVAACQAGAVDHTLKPQTRTLEVGAVILARVSGPLTPPAKANTATAATPMSSPAWNSSACCRPPARFRATSSAPRRQRAHQGGLDSMRGLPGRVLRPGLLLVGVLHVRHQTGDHRQGARPPHRTHHFLHGHPGPRQGL
jgi:ferredoxin